MANQHGLMFKEGSKVDIGGEVSPTTEHEPTTYKTLLNKQTIGYVPAAVVTVGLDGRVSGMVYGTH